MTSEGKSEKLFGEFPPVTRRQWEDKIREDLKGTDCEEKIIWHTPDGFDVQPFYCMEDLANLPFIHSSPGEFPYTRGYKTSHNDWEICQNVVGASFRECNRKAISLLTKGVDAPVFVLTEKVPGDIGELDELLADIDLQTVPLQFSLGENGLHFMKLLSEWLGKKKTDPAALKGSVDLDPLGHLFQTGRFYSTRENDLLSIKAVIEFATSHLPRFRVLAVKPEIFHQAGATISQELGLAMAMGVEYLSGLTELGLSPVQVADKMIFHFTSGPDYFPEIAKIRAARSLWSVITRAFSSSQTNTHQMRIHCSTTVWNQADSDPYNNLLRATTEAMSAILGGADSLRVVPFDNSTGQNAEFSERLARNIQLILREEAYFNKVADPSAGSFYIENLTSKISGQAWKFLIEIEQSGGIVNAFSKGMVRDMIERTGGNRVKN